MFSYKRKFSLGDAKLATPSKLATPVAMINLDNLANPIKSGNLLDLTNNLANLNNITNSNIAPKQTHLANSNESLTDTPIKRMRTCSDSPAVDTPPPTPTDRFESKIDGLKTEIVRLTHESDQVGSQLDGLMHKIETMSYEQAIIRAKKAIIQDTIEVSNISARMVRDLCNDIYHAGLKLAAEASNLRNDTRKSHKKNMEKILLELNNHLETSSEAIERRMAEVQHEIELHQRTLVHIMAPKEAEKAQQVAQPQPIESVEEVGKEDAKMDELEEGVVQVEQQPQDDEQDDEDDCQITGEVSKPMESEEMVVEVELKQENGIRKTKSSVEEDEVDSDATEIEEDVSFTPNQAQRPQ